MVSFMMALLQPTTPTHGSAPLLASSEEALLMPHAGVWTLPLGNRAISPANLAHFGSFPLQPEGAAARCNQRVTMHRLARDDAYAVPQKNATRLNLTPPQHGQVQHHTRANVQCSLL